MPGRWSSRGASSGVTKGNYLEGEVFDEDGSPQGTLVVWVKRVFPPGEHGRTFHGDLVTATDPYYQYWITTPEGQCTTVDGSYHLCIGNPVACPGGGGDLVVHMGRWRVWKEAELVEDNGTAFQGEAEILKDYFFKGKTAAEPVAAGHDELAGGTGKEAFEEEVCSAQEKGFVPEEREDGEERQSQQNRLSTLREEPCPAQAGDKKRERKGGTTSVFEKGVHQEEVSGIWFQGWSC